MKTLAKYKCRDSATVLHLEFNILIVGELYALKILIFVYKQRSNLHLFVFNQCYRLNSETRIRSSRQDAHLFILPYKNRIGENSLKLTGAQYNS